MAIPVRFYSWDVACVGYRNAQECFFPDKCSICSYTTNLMLSECASIIMIW